MISKLLQFKFAVKDDTAATFKKLNANLAGVQTRLGGIKTALAGAVGAAGFGIMAKNAVETADKIHKLNLRIGATPEALSQLAYAAGQSGVPVNTLAMAMQRATRRIAEAAEGTGEASGALEELGLEAGELREMRPEEQLSVLADAMQGLATDADKVRVAAKLFDSEGVMMLQMLKGGSIAIDEMRQKADDLGLTLSQDNVDAAAAFGDSMDNIKNIMQAIVTQITIAVAPAMTQVADKFTDWYKANKDLIKQNAVAVFERLKVTLENLWPVAKTVAEWIYKVADAAAKAAAAVANWIDRNTLSDQRRNQIIDEAWGGGGGNQANTPAPGSAAAVAAAGGGAGFTGADAEAWAFGNGGGGTTIVNNLNGQYSRSDLAQMNADQARIDARQ